MPIDLTGLPDKKGQLIDDKVDLSGLPDNNQDILQTQYRTDPTVPEKEAQVYDIAKRTQLPPQTVRSDVAKAKRIADEPDWESLQREAPNLAAKLRENPDLFRVAKGSLDELSAFEKVAKVLGVPGLVEMTFRAPEMIQRNLMTLDRNLNPMHELYRRYRQAVLDNPAYADLKARGALPEQASEFVLNNPLMEQLQRPIEFSSTIADAISEQIEYEGQATELGQYIGDTMKRSNVATMAAINGDFGPLGDLLTDPKAMGVLVGQGAASLAVALASRGSILPIMLMESGEAASEIARLERETGVKISDEDYLLATSMKGLIGGYLERAGAGGFAFDEASGALSALMRVLSSTAGEAGTEFGQALTGNVAKLLTYDPDANPAEDLLASSIAGFGLGLGVQSTTEAGYGTKALVDASMQKKFVERQKKVIKADRSSAVVNDLMARARDAKLRDLSPDAFEEIVEAQVADTELAEVYFDSQDLADHYAQQDMTIDEALADMPDVLQQWYEVEATGGGDVVVPLQKITRHLLDRPEDAGLENHVRFNADDLSKMEADSYRQTDAQDEFAEEADRIIKEKSDDELFVASVKVVEDHAFAQLETANRFSSDVNRTNAKVVANFYTVQAARLGITPEEMAERYPLSINAVTAKGPQISFATGPLPKGNRGKVALYAGEQINIEDQSSGEIEIPESLVSIIPAKPEIETRKGKLFVPTAWIADVRRRVKERYPQITDMNVENGVLDDVDGRSPFTGFFVNVTRSDSDEVVVGVRHVNTYLKVVDALIKKYDMVATDPDSFQQQAPQIESEAFQNWFGDSKAVDENGAPLVVHHGSRGAENDFDTFRDEREVRILQRDNSYREETVRYPLWFSDSEDYVRQIGHSEPRAFYLSIKNPLDMRELGSKAMPEEIRAFYKERGFDLNPMHDGEYLAPVFDEPKGSQIYKGEVLSRVEIFEQAGYDGVILAEDDGATSYIAFRSNQVKSATDNEGTFDPNERNVYKQQDNYFQDDKQLAPLNRAQKNNLGLFSAVEQAVIDMKLQGWNAKQARKNFTEADEKRLLELEDKVHMDMLAAREAVFPAEEQADIIKVASQMRFYLAVTHFYQGATPEQLANPLEVTGWGQDILQAVADGMTEAEAKTKYHELQEQYAEYEKKKRLAGRAEEDFNETSSPDKKKLEKLRLRKRAKEVGGLASGKEIWQKVSKMPGVKNEELETLGLEAFLLAGEKFSRNDVIEFVRNNGVEIEEVVGSTDPDTVDEDEITWDEQIDEDSENWQYRVEDHIYEFERTDFVSEMDGDTDSSWFWDHKQWIEDNYEAILDKLGLDDKRIPGQEDFMVGGEGDIGQAGDIQSLLLTAIEYESELDIDVEEGVRVAMRNEFEEAAEKAAEEEYMNNPYYNVTSPEIPNTYIHGNDDVGWTINGEYHDIFSLDEAKIQAVNDARDAGDITFERESNRAQWGTHVIDNSDVEDTYRELKLTLPNNPGPQFYETGHFEDPNIVAFLRVTDRHLTLDDEPLQVTPKIHHQEEAGQLVIGGNLRYLAPGYYILDEFEDGTLWNFSTRFADRETAERRIQYWHTQSRKPMYHSYFVDESQSDWHQTAQQSGYTDPDFNRSEAVDKRVRLETIVNNDLEAAYQRLRTLAETDIAEVETRYGVSFDESRTMLVPVQRASGIDGESVGEHAFVQYAWNILRNSPAAQSALADDQVMPTGLNQVASYRYISQILDAEINDNDRRVLETLVKEYDEVDATIRRDVESVPDAPFKGNAWVELSVRRAIVDAVENGYHAFGWADTGMVIDRWNDYYAVGYESHYNEKWVSIVKKVTGQTPKHFTWEDGQPIPPPVKPTIIVKQLTEEDVRNETVSASVRNTFRPGRWYWELEWPVDEDGDQRFRSSMTATNGQFETEKDARKAAKREAIVDYTDEIGYWVVPLTQEFKDKIRAEGLPLFQDQTRGLFTPETSTITLLEDANLSTFLHEFGHFQLEVMADLAGQHGTPKEIKQDMQTILDWFGVENVNAWNRMSLEEKRKHHEKFARGFEKYLYTGKAPNSQLSDIFARIREWMINVYKSIKALNVTLTPEVTEVFDRLVASEEQISEAEELQGYRQLFKSEEESGMTPAEWRKYQDEVEKPSEDARRDLQNRALRDMQWLRNARSAELKKLQAKAKEKRAAIREEVEAEVMAEPIQQAIQFLKTGETVGPDGEEINVEKGHRLATAALQEMYPETALGNRDWRALPTGRYGLRGKDGLHPQVIANAFGFASGDDLVAELLAAENAKEKIEGITDTRMLEQYGELSSPEALEVAVDNAIHNEARTKLIATELVALEKATGKKRSLLRAAKKYAKDVIGNMEVRNVRKANRFAVTERKAAREAELALRRGDRELAAKHRRSQLVANLMYREALKAKDEVPKMLRLFNKFQKPGVRKNLDQQYLDQIDQLLERYELRSSVSQHQIDRRISLNNWVEAQTEATGGVEPAIDPRLLNEAARTHYSRLTLNEMRGLYDSIRSIEHIARWKKKLLTAKDKREFKARMDEVVTSIEGNATKVVKERMENNGPLDKAADGWHEWFAMHRKLGSIVRAMDGLKDGGPVWELLLRPANERADYETVEHEKATEALNDILKPIYSQGRMNRKIDIPGTDKSISIEGRFVMLLNMGNAVNLDRLMEGELAHGWTEADFEAVKNSASKEEWDAVQAIWDYINGYWNEISAKQARVTGVAPEKVEAQEVVTPHGTYRGGYFPIKYNAKRSRQSDANTANELLEQKRKGNYSAATTRRGHTKERGKSGTGPLRYDMGVITEHVSDVIHDLAWHEWAIDANRVVRDKGFEAVVRKHYGDAIVKLLTHAVEDIVIGEVPAKNMFERVINHLRIGSTIVGLGYSIFTAALQPYGLAQSMVRIGPQHVLRGMGRWLGSTKNMEDSVGWIFENSDFMRLRNKTMMREMDEVLNQVRGEKLTKVKASFFVLIAKAQMIADMPTWIGQYHKSMEVTGGDHGKSVALADQAVKDSQGSGLGMDRAEIQRGGPLLKIFTNFYSYFNATFNLLAESKSQTDFRKPKEVGLFVVDFMLLTILPATMAAISREAIYQLTGGDDDEDKDGAEIAMWLARENLSYLSGLMVGAREISGALQGYYGYTGPAGLRFFGEFGKLMGQTGQGEIDEAFLKSLNQVGGLVFHYPAAQVERTAEGMLELAEGETVNPGVLLTGTE